MLPGARCLDAFAGSGALGLEALSRGASEVVLIEQSAPVARQLVENVRRLGADQVRIHHGDALQWLADGGPPFDIVFLDPPFAQRLWAPAIDRLARGGWVKPGGRVYLEAPARGGFPELPRGWELVRDKSAGQVRYGLVLAATDTDAVDPPGAAVVR